MFVTAIESPARHTVAVTSGKGGVLSREVLRTSRDADSIQASHVREGGCRWKRPADAERRGGAAKPRLGRGGASKKESCRLQFGGSAALPRCTLPVALAARFQSDGSFVAESAQHFARKCGVDRLATIPLDPALARVNGVPFAFTELAEALERQLV